MAFRDIRKSRKWLSAEEIRILVGLVLFMAVLLALNHYLARTLPGGEWLFQRWSGARAYLSQYFESTGALKYGRDMPGGEVVEYLPLIEPYGSRLSLSVQQIVYGRIAFPDEYRYVLSDPFYIVLLYLPLAVFPDFTTARALWMLLSEAALVFIVLFTFRLAEWSPPRALFIILMLFGLLSFFSVNALVTASPAIFLTFLYLSVLLALRSFSDELAGALLFLTAYQWEVSALYFLFILVFVLANRRWGVLAGLGMSLFIFLIISYLAFPGWGLPYVRATLSNLLQGSRLNLGSVLTVWFPEVRFSLGTAVSVIAIGMVFLESVGATQAASRRVLWTACLALAATPLLGLAIFPSNFVVLIPAVILVVALAWERWRRLRILFVALFLIVVFVAPFALYIQTVFVYAPLYTQLLSVLPPLIIIIALYWMRWWVVHSPRTWADQKILFRK